ncbi:type II toxin-antitoxin system MqsA family antitoxin [Spirosoma knui]
MTDKCSFCGNEEFKQLSTQYIYQRNGSLMVVDNVPALVCSYCGEKYYDIQTLKQIENRFNAIYQDGQPPVKQVSVPFESWDILKQAG